GLTITPLRGMTSTISSSISRSIAWCTGVRPNPSKAETDASLMHSPGLNLQVMIRCLMASYAASRSDWRGKRRRDATLLTLRSCGPALFLRSDFICFETPAILEPYYTTDISHFSLSQQMV